MLQPWRRSGMGKIPVKARSNSFWRGPVAVQESEAFQEINWSLQLNEEIRERRIHVYI